MFEGCHCLLNCSGWSPFTACHHSWGIPANQYILGFIQCHLESCFGTLELLHKTGEGQFEEAISVECYGGKERGTPSHLFMWLVIPLSILSTVATGTSLSLRGHSTRGRTSTANTRSLVFPAAQYFYYFYFYLACTPLLISLCSSCTWSLSFRLEKTNHLPRLLTGCSDSAGVGSSQMKNLRSDSTPLMMEMLRDLGGLTSYEPN